MHCPGDPAIRSLDTSDLGKLTLFQNQEQSLLRLYHAGPLLRCIIKFRCRRPVPAQGNLVVRTVYILSTLPGLLLRESDSHTPIPWLSPGTHQEQDIRESSLCQSLFDRAHLSKAQAEPGGEGELPEEPLLSTAETYLLLPAEGFISAFCLPSDLHISPSLPFQGCC